MNELEEDRPMPLALPRPQLVPCGCAQMAVEVSNKEVTVTHADLVAHAGRDDVAGAVCTSSSFATVWTGGARMPDVTHLRTRQPLVLEMWQGDALRMSAGKPGTVLLLPVVSG